MIWHSNNIQDVLKELQVDSATGLSAQEAADRLEEYGNNSLKEYPRLPFSTVLMQQLRSPLTVMLLVGAGATTILSLYQQLLKNIVTDWQQPLIVGGLTAISVVAGALQKRRAADAVASTHTLSAPEVRVFRDGREQVCSAHELVPGDILRLTVGDVVPADCRLIDSCRLRCDESHFTDATLPTEKEAEAIFDDITPLAERINMLYAGSAVTHGTATAVVVATGERSEMSHHTHRNRQTATAQPMEKTVGRVNRWWSAMVVVLCIVAFIVGLTRYPNRLTVLLTAATLLMAAIPPNLGDLLAQLTSRNILQLSRHHVRLCRPEAVETLSKVSVVCAEEETMYQGGSARLCRAFVGHRVVDLTTADIGAPGLAQLLRLAALGTHENDSTDEAILAYAAEVGIEKSELLMDMPRIGELPPTEERKTAVHLAGEQTLILVSGHWRPLLPLCIKGNTDELTAAATAMEESGLQVVAVTYHLSETAPAVYTAAELEQELTCVGLLGIQLPLRDNVREATGLVPSIRTILFSDQPATTAIAAARQAGLTTKYGAVTAEEMEDLSNRALDAVAQKCNVYCGLNPEQKQRVVAALQYHGHTVAVTACHSEEAALLKAADIGCARGTVATDVAKNAADMLLMDDSYASMMAAIWEGRQLKQQVLSAFIYLALCSLVIAVVGVGCLTGLMVLHRQAIFMAVLHLVLIAILPTFLWSAKGIVEKK